GRPATFLNRASSRYVEENRNCFSPIRNTPTARMTSVPRTNAPTRTGLHMAASSLGISQERVHERFAAVLQIVEGALRENGAFVDERKAVGDGPRAVQVVRHDDRRGLALLLKREYQVLDFRRGDRIEAGGGLVEQKNVGIQRQGARQSDPLLHAAGNLGGQFAGILVHPHLRQQTPHAVPALGRRERRVLLQGKGHVFLDAQRVVQRALLKEESDLLPHLVQRARRQPRDVGVVDTDRPRVGPLQADDQFEQNALARSAAPQDGQRFSLRHVEVDAVEHLLGAKRLAQALQRDGR